MTKSPTRTTTATKDSKATKDAKDSKDAKPGKAAAQRPASAKPAPAQPTPDQAMPPHPVLRYTSLRLMIFVAILGLGIGADRLGILPLAGSGGALLLLALAMIISGAISYVVLNRQRDAMSAAVVARVRRTKEGIAAGAAGEDDAVEAAARAKRQASATAATPATSPAAGTGRD